MQNVHPINVYVYLSRDWPDPENGSVFGGSTRGQSIRIAVLSE